jgi:hypothetical protein
MYYDAQALPLSRTFASASKIIIGLIIIFLLTINHLSLKPNADHRRELLFSFQDNDYKTVTSREGHPLNELVVGGELQHQFGESPFFIVPEANLAATRHVVPTVIRNRLPPQGSTVVDIVSIGSNTRSYLVSAVSKNIIISNIIIFCIDAMFFLICMDTHPNSTYDFFFSSLHK